MYDVKHSLFLADLGGPAVNSTDVEDIPVSISGEVNLGNELIKLVIIWVFYEVAPELKLLYYS